MPIPNHERSGAANSGIPRPSSVGGEGRLTAGRRSGEVTVIVVSDIRLYREGLDQQISRDGRLQVLATGASAAEAFDLIRRLAPGVVLVDMGMAGALATVEGVRRRYPSTKVVALGISERRQDVLACAEAGAWGYATRQSTLDQLVEAVLGAVNEELYCPARIAAALLHRVSQLASLRSQEDDVYLTPRETEVAGLIDRGLTNKEIAHRLGIETTTVKVHVHNILDKVGVHHRGQAASLLRDAGRLRDRRPG